MEQPRYLIDTNAVIDYLGKKLPSDSMQFMHSIIDAIPNVSVITKIEVLGYNAPEEHTSLLTSFMSDAMVLDLSPEIVDICIEIRKKYKTKLPDAIIASTALAFDLTLITHNISDFKNIEKLPVIDSYALKSD